MSSQNNSTVVIFDIRKFSEHRYHLGLIKGGGSLMNKLVKEILEKAVEIVNSKQSDFGGREARALNHTGDGFVLIVSGNYSPLVALSFISLFRDFVSLRLKTYEEERIKHFPNCPITKLGFGIGAHWGLIGDFDFKDFYGRKRGASLFEVGVASPLRAMAPTSCPLQRPSEQVTMGL